MRLRTISDRVLVLVLLPLLSLIAIYAFATALTAGSAITLSRATAIRDSVNDPIGLFEAQVQTERLLATLYLAAPAPQNLSALRAQESRTNGFLRTLRAAARSPGTTNNAAPPVKAALSVLLRDIRVLPGLRQQVSTRAIGRPAAQGEYTQIVEAGWQTIIQTVLVLPNTHLQAQALAVMRITEGSELLLQEQALFDGDVTARSFPPAAHAQFAQLVGEHRGLVSEAMHNLDPAYQANYRKYASPAAIAALTGLENAVINTPAGTLPRAPVTAALDQTSGAVAFGYDLGGYQNGLGLATYGHQAGRPVYLRIILVGSLGLLAVLASLITSIWIGRGLVRELGGLRNAALDLANVRLPQVMARLSAGEDVAIAAGEVPFPNPTRDEIGQVRQAFNAVQRTAVEAAVGQARLRAGIAIVFRNLARRSQSLLHRQLSMLDDLELRADSPDELDALFQIDHLTTRMRRHAEGLVVLAGDRPGRVWNRPVPLSDVLRAAVAEVEQFHRVKVITRNRAALAGRAVADVIHLLAELVENATVFSPASTPVRVLGDQVAHGFAVEIEDRGLGMSDETVAGLNARLVGPPQIDLDATEHLGIYVAARLASQHGIRITLRDSPFGGTTAIVLIPDDLVVSEESYATDPDAGLANELAIRATGRHAVWDQPSAGQAAAGQSWPGEMNDVAAATRFTPSQADEQPERGDHPQASADALTGLDLPRRTRQANLVPQLRDPKAPDAGTAPASPPGDRPPGAVRDTFTALQRGWEGGRAAARPDARRIPPGDSPPSGPPEDGHAPGAPGQDVTP
jgi:signal transduction histidine kinase